MLEGCQLQKKKKKKKKGLQVDCCSVQVLSEKIKNLAKALAYFVQKKKKEAQHIAFLPN